MATQLSELVISIRAQSDGINSNLQKSLDKAQKQVADAQQSLGNGLAEVQGKVAASMKALSVTFAGTMAAVAASITTTVTAAFKRGVEEIDNLSAQAQKLGMSTGGLAALEHAAKMTDTAFEAVTKSVERMQTSLSLALGDRGKVQASALKQLSLDAVELRKLAPEEQFARIADALKQIRNRGDQMSIAKDIFGKGGVDVLNMLDAGKTGMKEMAEQARVLGLVLEEGPVAAIGEFDNSLNVIQATWSGFSRQMAGEFAPYFKGMGDEVTKMLARLGGMPMLVKTASFAVQELGAGALDAAQHLKAGYDMLGGWRLQATSAAKTMQSVILSAIAKAAEKLQEMIGSFEVAFKVAVNVVSTQIETTINALIKSSTEAVEKSINAVIGGYNKLPKWMRGDDLASVTLPVAQVVTPKIENMAPTALPQEYQWFTDNLNHSAELLGQQAIQAQVEGAQRVNAAVDGLNKKWSDAWRSWIFNTRKGFQQVGEAAQRARKAWWIPWRRRRAGQRSRPRRPPMAWRIPSTA